MLTTLSQLNFANIIIITKSCKQQF